MILADLSEFVPEILLTLYALAALMVGVYFNNRDVHRFIYNATIIVFLVLAVFYFFRQGRLPLFNNFIIDDGFGRFLKIMIMLSSAAVLAASWRYFLRRDLIKFEIPVLMALSILGMCIMVMANNLLSLYIGLELQSLSLYVLAGIRRDHLRSSEAGIKYFTLGALSSGLYLFGASLAYGFTGTLDFGALAAIIGAEPSVGAVFGLAFLLAAMAFKISAAPFHMWTPDVYQGAPTPITAFFASAPKIAAAGMLARLVYAGFGEAIAAWSQILWLLAVASFVVGAVGGIGQSNVKRLLAYSSILNMGFVIMALSAGSVEGLAAAIVYLMIYVVATIGTFALVMAMERDGREVVQIVDFGQMSVKAPLIAVGLAVLMFSTAGVPPLAGFLGKYAALDAAVNGQLSWLAVIAVLASVVAAYYYIRLVYLAYFGDEPSQDYVFNWNMPQLLVFTGAALLIVVWIFGLWGLDVAALDAARSLIE